MKQGGGTPKSLGADVRFVVDAGDAFLPEHRVPEADAPRWWATAEYIVARYGALGVDALGLGDRDLGLGRARLEGLIKAASFPITSASLVDKASRKPVARPFVLVERGGAKVAFVSLMSNVKASALAEELVRDGLEVLAPGQAWAEVEDDLKAAGADIVVILSQLEELEERKLGEAHPMIRAFLGGDSMMSTGETKRVGDAWIFPGGQKGKMVGVVSVALGAGFGRAWGQGDLRANLTRRRDDAAGRAGVLERQIARQKERMASQATGTEAAAASPGGQRLDPTVLLQNMEGQLAQARAELQLAEGELATLPPDSPVAGNTFTFRLDPMSATVPDDPDEAKAVGDFRARWPAPAGH